MTRALYDKNVPGIEETQGTFEMSYFTATDCVPASVLTM